MGVLKCLEDISTCKTSASIAQFLVLSLIAFSRYQLLQPVFSASSARFKLLLASTITMKISAVLLFAEAALAARLTHVRRDRAAKRALERLTKPKIASTIQDTTSNNDSQVEYSSNWAGAVLIGSGYTSVVGTITVPTPEVPSGGDSSEEYCASAWVGIDGDTCQTAILQTGVDFCVQDGSISFDTWYEWYPGKFGPTYSLMMVLRTQRVTDHAG